MSTAVAAETPSRSRKALLLEILVTLAVFGLVLYFTQNVFSYQAGLQSGIQTLGDQVSEVAGRARLTANMRLDEFPAIDPQASPVVASVVSMYGMAQVSPSGLRAMFADTERAVPGILRIDRGSLVLKQNEPVPGLSWHGDGVYNAWNGKVTVYRKDELVLVAYTNVPQDFCAHLRLGFQHGVGNYLFACNDDIIVVQEMGSWHADPAGFRAKAQQESL